MIWLWLVAGLWLGVGRGQAADSDSLRGALEAISRRQRDLADPTLYYVEHFHPSRERLMYPRHGDGDGQPEDIGYGYQKTLSPKTAGIFEAFPVPENELGSHDPGVESYSPDGKDLENIILDYIEDNVDNSANGEPQRYYYRNQNSDTKRSVFRERDANEAPEALQNLYSEGDGSDQYYANGEHPQIIPSSFRERYSSKSSRNHNSRNTQSLVKNINSQTRDRDNFPGNDNDPDEYLSVLNSVWEKYQDSNPDNFDPEDLSESDVAEILDYFNHKDEKKRQHENSYQNGYDFFNSPLTWVKRDRQRLNENSKPPSDQFLHALKFLNGHTDTLESIQDEDVPDEEKDADVARLLMDEQQGSKTKRYKVKRFWRGNTYEDYHKGVKRYPIAKRSSSYYSNPAHLYHKTEKLSQRRKKNVQNHQSLDSTDPKIVRELNNIFSPTDTGDVEKGKNVNSTVQNAHLDKSHGQPVASNKTSINTSVTDNSSKESFDEVVSTHTHNSHVHKKRSGQKEETGDDPRHKPLEMSKKSVDWSDYFGIDRRRKKSMNKPGNDEWLLDQYLKAYTISARAIKEQADDERDSGRLEMEKKSSDDMDAKLRAMEDMIVDQALKYTGAHEGTTDSKEVQAVKDRVLSQLAAAYSLEKMRKALSEFKSSIAAQKASAPVHTSTTNAPTDEPELKDKRVAVKKEKAGLPPHGKLEKKEDPENGISVLYPSHQGHPHSGPWSHEDSCPVMEDITQRCKEVASMSGDNSEALVPLCNLHQVCYLCGSEMGSAPSGCDFTFLSEANALCGDSAHCRYTARRSLSTLRSLRGDPSPAGCDWQTHPCLARYLAITVR